MRFRLEQPDQELVRAEMRGADFGIHVVVALPVGALARAESALAATLAAWPSLRARIERADGDFVVVADPEPAPGPEGIRAYAASSPLAESTILAARGGRLLRYHLDEAAAQLHLLGHHLVLDADSLDAFLGDLDRALAGEPVTGAAEWPWTAVSTGGVEEPRPGAVRGGEASASDLLVPKGRPVAGTHVRRVLSPQQVEAVTSAARAAGASPFALFWAAGERLGESTLGAVVSTRLTAAIPSRAGNATAYLSVAATATGTGREFVRAAFEDVVATWAGARPPAPATAGQLLVSHAQPPSAGRFRVIADVRLGEYVVKYPRHIQIQTDADTIVLEAYAATGVATLLDRYAAALDHVVAECLGTASPAAESGSTESGSTELVSTGLATPEVAAAEVAGPGGARLSIDTDPLSRILAAPAHDHLRDLGISSLDVLAILDGLGERFGVRVGVEAFYGWETAGEVQAVAGSGAISARGGPGTETAGAAGLSGEGAWGGTGGIAGGGTAYDPDAAVVLPHLNDIFIDAFRHAADDPYGVEYAFVVDPALGLTRTALATALARVVSRHEAFSAGLGFSRDGVVLRPRASGTPVREVSGSAYDQIRDPRRLTLRAPAHVADIAVAQVGGDLVVYLNIHHLLLDHVGLAHLLADLDAELTRAAPRPSTPWAVVAPRLEAARAGARDVWRSAPPVGTPTGRGGLPGGGYRQCRIDWGTGADVDLAAELDAITRIVAAFTGERAGVIGSVHHGRTVPGTDRLVGNLARMLPAHYDIDDPAVVRASARRLLAGQAATLADLAVDPGQAMPIVFHVVREDAVLPPSLVRRIDFPARTKFALLFTLVVANGSRTLEVTIADDLYTAAEAQQLIDLARSAAAVAV